MKILVFVFIGVCVSALSGCGQKGDLYLPEIPPAPNVGSANTVPETVDKTPSSKKKVPNETDSLPASDSKE